MTALRITDDTDTATVLDVIEARTRRLMAERAGLPLTWQTRARRAELQVEIGQSLDEWLRVGGVDECGSPCPVA